jgi:hypothetical protein
MLGKLAKALAGCIIGGLTGLFMGKYAGSIGIGGSMGGVAYSDVVAAAILGVIAFLTRSRETIGTIFTVACSFQIAAIIVKLVWQAVEVPTA